MKSNLKETTISPKDLSKLAREWWAGTDESAFIDGEGRYWIGTSKTDAELFGSIEDLDRVFCEFQEEADAILEEEADEEEK